LDFKLAYLKEKVLDYSLFSYRSKPQINSTYSLLCLGVVQLNVIRNHSCQV